MSKKKVLIICKSVHHNNTKKIAEAMAEVLDAEIKKPSEVDIEEVGKYDLIGFGSGIYWGKHHPDIFKIVDQLIESSGNKAFLFSTSGTSNAGNFLHNIRHLVSHFHVHLRRELKNRGIKIIGEFSCRGFDTAGPLKQIGGISKGRPNKEDLENAKDFARGILVSEQVKEGKGTDRNK